MNGGPQVEVLPDPERSLVATDGPLASVQSALVTMKPETLERLWRAENLERLARAYWQYLHRFSLRALRVDYGEHSRSVLLFGRIELLRFHEPLYERSAALGRVTWPIERGILVARRGRGQGDLTIEIEHAGEPGTALVTTRVSNFYPWLRGSGRFARLGRFVYAQTQLRIHVFVTKGFLRSLERLDLPALPEPPPAPPPEGSA